MIKMDEVTTQDTYRAYNRDGFYTVVKITYDGEGNIDSVEGPVFPLAADVDGLRLQLLKMAQAVEVPAMNAETLERVTDGKVKAAFLDGDGVPSRDPEAIEADGSFVDSSRVVEERGAIEEEQRRAEVQGQTTTLPEPEDS